MKSFRQRLESAIGGVLPGSVVDVTCAGFQNLLAEDGVLAAYEMFLVGQLRKARKHPPGEGLVRVADRADPSWTASTPHQRTEGQPWSATRENVAPSRVFADN
jgi:hypothetical protein